jgi:hypothetical protein
MVPDNFVGGIVDDYAVLAKQSEIFGDNSHSFETIILELLTEVQELVGKLHSTLTEVAAMADLRRKALAS